jgi:hypothetical protein
MTQKIALCFLTYDNLSQPDLWSKFIEPRFNFYIHNKNDITGEFNKYIIKNKINTKWGDLSLVKATLLLFKEAYDTEENQYFVLLSDKCIPLYKPDELYDKIVEIDNSVYMNSNSEQNRYNSLHDKTFFDEDNFTKQSQWMILNRDTINFFIENDYTHIFGENSIVPDEHYFINIMNKFQISYKNKKMTYTNWHQKSESVKNRMFPKTYDILTNDMVYEILNSECLFMRKVSSECKLPSYFIDFIKKTS